MPSLSSRPLSKARWPLVITTLTMAVACNLGGQEPWEAEVKPNLEDTRPDGSPFNPSTQSFIRGHHWLDSISKIEVHTDRQNEAHFELSGADGTDFFRIENLPINHLMPRLYYETASPPDAFDAFNLMMAEYSRNGVSIPVGQRGDDRAHFETSLDVEVPWTLNGDFGFVAAPRLRPLRFAVVNNCLAPGLWELSATDRAGEIYHAWFEAPADAYHQAVAEANGVHSEFAAEALKWRLDPSQVDLDRLRTVETDIGDSAIKLAADTTAGFSSQDSRRKLAARFALVEGEDGLQTPESWRQFLSGPVHLSEFVPPGKYSIETRRVFDLSFLADPQSAHIRQVEPLTSYQPRAKRDELEAGEYIEIELGLGDRTLLIGNLPLALLIPAEEFVLHGFGVGILSASGIAERRDYLLKDGPAPSFAYLLEESPNGPLAINSHELGVEQIFIRTHLNEGPPWWEITITSYERIVDLVKYRVDIPPTLHERIRAHARQYVTPLYYSYRDDNLR